MKELTKNQKIFVLKEMIRYYQEKKGHVDGGLCYLSLGIIQDDFRQNEILYYYEVRLLFPELFNNQPDIGWWWPLNKEGSIKRIEHCKKVLKLIESK